MNMCTFCYVTQVSRGFVGLIYWITAVCSVWECHCIFACLGDVDSVGKTSSESVPVGPHWTSARCDPCCELWTEVGAAAESHGGIYICGEMLGCCMTLAWCKAPALL